MKNKLLVTSRMLRYMDACSEQQYAFKEVFNGRCKITLENVRKAWDAGLQVGWFVTLSVTNEILDNAHKQVDVLQNRLNKQEITYEQYESGICEIYYKTLIKQVEVEGELEETEGPF